MSYALRFGLLCILFSIGNTAFAQVINPGMTDRDDSTELGKVRINGYVDAYYSYNFNHPASGNRLYAVSSARDRELNINLAFIDIRYQTQMVRARLVPGFGTYVNANYANEPGTLKNMIEAYAGVKLSKKKEIWVDAGIIGSPFTNESAISRDHLMYSRSLAAEYVPYYLSGVRISAPILPKLTGYFYLINGWQHIEDPNGEPALALQLEYRPHNRLLLNVNFFRGNERSGGDSLFRDRTFGDFYLIFNPDGKLSITSSIYVGRQDYRKAINQELDFATWWQGNIIAQYRFTPKFSLAGRWEGFQDESGVMLQKPVMPGTRKIQRTGIKSASLCLNYKVNANALFRLEGRHFYTQENFLIGERGLPVYEEFVLFSNLTVWF